MDWVEEKEAGEPGVHSSLLYSAGKDEPVPSPYPSLSFYLHCTLFLGVESAWPPFCALSPRRRVLPSAPRFARSRLFDLVASPRSPCRTRRVERKEIASHPPRPAAAALCTAA